MIHVAGPSSVTEAQKVSEQVDALLLDSGNPDLPVKELGGTGRVHNWSISASIRESVNVPIYLAGGLNGTNVTAAIEAVAPFGIDVCSGVRTNGVLDEAKLSKFFIAVTGGTIG